MSVKLPLYKKKPTSETNVRELVTATNNEKVSVNSTISKFAELFKNKHL